MCVCLYTRRGCKHVGRGSARCKQAAGPYEVSGGWISGLDKESAANPDTIKALIQTDRLTCSSPHDSTLSLNPPHTHTHTKTIPCSYIKPYQNKEEEGPSASVNSL